MVLPTKRKPRRLRSRLKASDAGVGQEFRYFHPIETGHRFGVEAGEGSAVGIPFLQDRDPGEPGLCALQYQELEQKPVVVDRHPPFPVVVGPIERFAADPTAAAGVFGFHRIRTPPSVNCFPGTSDFPGDPRILMAVGAPTYRARPPGAMAALAVAKEGKYGRKT